MQNRSVLITGCSSGIGLHIAQALQQRGYQVFASARKPEDVARLRNQGLNCLILDLNNSNSIQQAVTNILKETQGKLYAVINNAAYGQQGAVEDLSRDALRQQFETNVFGLVELTNLILPAMHQQGYGRIIQISSVLGFVATPFSGAYVASKFALEGITDTLRLELHNNNVHVSLIQPGPIKSEFRQNALNKYKETIANRSSRFSENYKTVEKKYTDNSSVMPFTLGPDAVLKKVIHCLESRKPKSRYLVTFPTYLLAYLKRLLPTRALDFILLKSSNLKDK